MSTNTDMAECPKNSTSQYVRLTVLPVNQKPTFNLTDTYFAESIVDCTLIKGLSCVQFMFATNITAGSPLNEAKRCSGTLNIIALIYFQSTE